MAENKDPTKVAAFHITDVANLSSIVRQGGLLADSVMVGRSHANIGYDHIKQRRLTHKRVTCCPGQPFVGEFVPFYFCDRSIMLYVVNCGRTGRPAGCQTSILHLVCRASTLAGLGQDWAISDGNASAEAALFSNDLNALNELNWTAINARYWNDVSHQKQAEFLVKGSVPWSAVELIGCYDDAMVTNVRAILGAAGSPHVPRIEVKRTWYY